MKEVLVLPTGQPEVVLRELATDADDMAYYAAYSASRPEIMKFEPEARHRYLTLESVILARLNAGDRVRMGIWDNETFVGSIKATPDPDEKGAEIGYWLHSAHTGKGYATVATQALSQYSKEHFGHVHAQVVEGNDASARVLERAGFKQTAKETGRLIFELLDKQEPRKISLTDTEHFEREGFSGNIYVSKDANAGFFALQVDVHGRHPRKRMLEGTTRTYYVSDGTGSFTIGNETQNVTKGDLYVIPPGGEYEYEGNMTLLEFNVSPDNSFGDEKLE